MGFLDRLLKMGKGVNLPELDVSDGDIVAVTDGKMVDIKSVSDPMFAEEMLGKSVAFKIEKDSAVICSPANGRLETLFPTGHAFGIVTKEGVEILVHIGVDTVYSKGEGFKLLGKKREDEVRAGDPIVKVDFGSLSKKYDMSVMLILTNTNGKEISFIDLQDVERGTSLIRK